LKDPIRYKLGKPAGPSAVFSGYILLAAGLATLYFTLSALFLIVFGAALALSYEVMDIHYKEKYFHPGLLLFGIISIGKKIPFKEGDTLILKHFKGVYTASSLSNRITKTHTDDYRILLHNPDSGQKADIARFLTREEAEAECEKLKQVIGVN
jgi:hypothetical protein